VWLARAAAADTTGETGAYERLTGGLDEVVDLLEEADLDGDDADGPSDAQPSS
jgi:hypothetical protein